MTLTYKKWDSMIVREYIYWDSKTWANIKKKSTSAQLNTKIYVSRIQWVQVSVLPVVGLEPVKSH